MADLGEDIGLMF